MSKDLNKKAEELYNSTGTESYKNKDGSDWGFTKGDMLAFAVEFVKSLSDGKDFRTNTNVDGVPSADDVVIADIRNKMSPVVHLISIMEDNNIDDEYKKDLIPEAINGVKRSTNYLCQRDVFNNIK